MRHTIAIIDRDIEYGAALASYINAGKKLPFFAVSYSGIETFLRGDRGRFVRIILAEEELLPELHEGSFLIGLSENLLSENGSAGEGSRPECLYKYQRAEALLRRIMLLYSREDEALLSWSRREEGTVIGVFSPINRCAKTSLSLALAGILGEDGLWIGFEEFSDRPWDRSYPDLSDLLYHFKKAALTWEKISACISRGYGFPSILPPRYTEDIWELGASEYRLLIKKLARESGFSYLVVDFGSLGFRGREIFELCSVIYLPVLSEESAEKKLAAFYDYLEVSHRSHLLPLFSEVHIPADYCRETSDSHVLPHLPLGSYARKLLTEAGYA